MTDTIKADKSEADTKTENLVPEAPAPLPTVAAEFHVEPHPDPIIQSLILEIEELRRENSRLKAELHEKDA